MARSFLTVSSEVARPFLRQNETGRICRGIELDPLYVDTAIRRWQNLTGKDAIRLSDRKPFRDIEAVKEQEDER